MPDVLQPGEAVTALIQAIEQKVKPRSIEMGYEPEAGGNDPKPGDPATWYVEIVMSPTLTVRRRARGLGEVPLLEALAAAAEAVGVRVRLQYRETEE